MAVYELKADFGRDQHPHSEGLKIGHLNSNGLWSKIDPGQRKGDNNIRALIIKYDVFAVTETKLTADQKENINDHTPTFEQSVYNINISETESVGSVIMRIRADDLDVGPNKDLVYSIVNTDSLTNFAMDRTTGDISIANKLDRENVTHYIFVVKAEDQATTVADRLSSTVTANVNVLDYNDNAPVFSRNSYDFSVREDINVSTGPVVIGEIVATDADYGNNGIIK